MLKRNVVMAKANEIQGEFIRPFSNKVARSGGLLPASFPVRRFGLHLDRQSVRFVDVESDLRDSAINDFVRKLT